MTAPPETPRLAPDAFVCNRCGEPAVQRVCAACGLDLGEHAQQPTRAQWEAWKGSQAPVAPQPEPEPEPVVAVEPAPERPVAGWYPDPHDRRQLRWWDGSDWTGYTSSKPGVVTQEPELVAVPAGDEEPEADVSPVAASPLAAATATDAAAEPQNVGRTARRPWQDVLVHAPDAIGTRVTLAGAAVLLVSILVLPWYSLSLSSIDVAGSLPLASTAPQWMPGTAWLLGVIAVSVAVIVFGSTRYEPLALLARSWLGAWSALSVVVIVWRLVDRPLLPGTAASFGYRGTVGVGIVIGLLGAILMTLGTVRFLNPDLIQFPDVGHADQRAGTS